MAEVQRLIVYFSGIHDAGVAERSVGDKNRSVRERIDHHLMLVQLIGGISPGLASNDESQDRLIVSQRPFRLLDRPIFRAADHRKVIALAPGNDWQSRRR